MDIAHNDSQFQTNSVAASPPRQVLWLLGGQEPRQEEINYRPTPFLFHNLLSLNSNPTPNPNPNPRPLAGPHPENLLEVFHSDTVLSLNSNPTPNPNTNPRPVAVPHLGNLLEAFHSDTVLSLNSNPTLNPNPNPIPNPNPNPNPGPVGGPIRKRRSTASRRIGAGKSEEIPAKFAWATRRRAGVKSEAELSEMGIKKVVGEVQCGKCVKRFSVEIEIGERFSALRDFVVERWENLRDRSAPEWDTPAMVDCRECGAKESAKGMVAEKKRDINWLFLLLGGFLCCCSLEQLKYFCKHTGNHRTGAKNRLLYLTYLSLCKQLDPSGPFEVV